MKTLSHAPINHATILVWNLLHKGLNPTTIAEKTKMNRKTLWGHIRSLEKRHCIIKKEKVGRTWTYSTLRQPSIVSRSPATLVNIVSKPFYLPHNIFGFFDVVSGEIGRAGKDCIRYWLQKNKNSKQGTETVHLEFSVNGCNVDYFVGPTGKQGFRVDVPEELVSAPSVELAQRQVLQLMRGAADRFALEKGLQPGEGWPFKTSFFEWVQQSKALSKQVIAEAELKRRSVVVDTPEGPDLVLTTMSHFGDEQHTGPGAGFGAKQGELLWSGKISESIRGLSGLVGESVEATRTFAVAQRERDGVTEAKLQALEVALQRTVEAVERLTELVGRKR